MRLSTFIRKLFAPAAKLRKELVFDKQSAQVVAQPFSNRRRVNQFTAREWAEEAIKMLRSDAKLYGASQQLRNSLLSASWYVEAAGEDEESERNAVFIRKALGLDGERCRLQSGSFEAELRKVLDFCLIGHQECEEVFYSDAEGTWLAELADIAQSTVNQWLYDEHGNLRAILQVATSREYAPGYVPESQVEIPAAKLQIYTYHRRGCDYEGHGILSPCWVWWRLKDELIDYLTEGGAKWAVPTIILTVDRELLSSMSYTADDIDALLARACEAARAYKGGLENFIAVPQGINVSVFGGGNFDPSKIIAGIEHCNQEIASAFLANFLELGVSTEGARNIGEIHRDAYRATIGNILDLVADVWNGPARVGGGTIARLLAMNFYGVATAVPLGKLPRLRHRGVEVDALADSLGNLPQLAASGFITPDDGIEIKLRRLMGINDPSRQQSDDVRLARMHVASVGSESGLRESEGGRPKGS